MADEKFDRICSDLERMVQLEKLSRQDGLTNQQKLDYARDHIFIMDRVKSYLHINYFRESLSLALDMYTYMVEQQKDRIEEVHAEYARKAEESRKDSEKLIVLVDKFTKDLQEINKQLNKSP